MALSFRPALLQLLAEYLDFDPETAGRLSSDQLACAFGRGESSVFMPGKSASSDKFFAHLVNHDGSSNGRSNFENVASSTVIVKSKCAPKGRI